VDYTAVFILACIFIPLERFFPMHSEQGTLRRDWMNDVFYVLFNGFAIRAGFVLVVAFAMWAFNRVAGPDPLPFVSALPLWVQVVAITIIADTGYYIAHRALHSIPVLWRFHVIHHSIEEMDWLASHRVHPVEMIFSNTLSLLPIYFLNFSLEAAIIHQFMYQAQTLFLHSNLRVNFGPLRWLFTSPEHHRWHHAKDRDARDTNFAAQLSVIDLIGGTIFMPKRRQPVGYGVREAIPRLYHQQFLHPFQKIVAMIRPAAKPKETAVDLTCPPETPSL
jgi:sterol desaturase/sphingolipid hydroxylase (fatty acid hydroxylase superfamily)